MNATTDIVYTEIFEINPEMLVEFSSNPLSCDQVEVIRSYTDLFVDKLGEWLNSDSLLARTIREHLSEIDFGDIFMHDTNDGLFFGISRIRDAHGRKIGSFVECREVDWGGSCTDLVKSHFDREYGIEVCETRFDGKKPYGLDMNTPDRYGKSYEFLDKNGNLVATATLDRFITIPHAAVSAIANDYAFKKLDNILSASKTMSPGY